MFVLILTEKEDITTNQVLDWFLYSNSQFQRINEDDLSDLEAFSISDFFVKIKTNSRDLNKNFIVWNRRGFFNFFNTSFKNYLKITSNSLNTYLGLEIDTVIRAVELVLKENTTMYIGSYNKELENNKIEVLLCARKYGLKIPKTLITTSKKELLFFFNEQKAIITKDLRYPVFFELGEDQYISKGTQVVTQEMISRLNEVFFPVLVQEQIEKKYEIRVFYYKKAFFSMAIFSQNDAKTTIDYRNYNREKPNRCVPVKLPIKIKRKIHAMLNELDIDTCSLDIIVNTKGEYVFLEINPMGQFGWLSSNCNYYIEKFIAEDLMSY